MQTVDQIIHAKWLITCSADNTILADHALVIKDGKIVALEPSATVANSLYGERDATF